MNRLATAAERRRNPRAPFAAVCAALSFALAAACSSGPGPETPPIPGFEPTVRTVQVGATDRLFMIDSNDVVVVSRDRSLIDGIYLLLDDAQLPYRRYFQTLPPRTAVGLLVQPNDSVLMDSVMRASRAPVKVWERVEIPRDNQGNPLPIARFLVSSVRNRVAHDWVVGPDTAAGRVPDWVVAGVTQLVTGFPPSTARTTQLRSQLGDLIPIDSLTRMRIPESAIPSGVAGDGSVGGAPGGRVDARGRTVAAAPPRRLPLQSLAALEAGSVVEFMWAREGRGIIKQLVDRTRRGEPLSAVLAQAVSLPHDVAALDSAWKASIAPPPKKK